MKLHYAKPNILSKLHDEILKAGITPDFVEGKGDDIWITVPDSTLQPVIDQINLIVANHDPTPIPPLPTDSELLRDYVLDLDYRLILVELGL